MTSAVVFLLYRTFRNRVASRMRRLRQPKYLVSALAGAAYLCFVFGLQFVRGRPAGRIPAAGFAADPELLSLLEAGSAILLLLVVLAPWLSPTRPRAVLFTEAEVQFLFPAPISRRTLLRFRIAKGQAGIIFGVLVSALIFFPPGLVLHRAYLLVAFWVVFTFLGLYRIGTALAKTSLAEHGMSGLKRQGWALGIVVVAVVAIAFWSKWVLAVPRIENPTPRELLRWLNALAEGGPAWWLLLPFRALVRPAFAPDFPGLLDRLVPALALLGAAYWWVLHGHASFEDAALERAEAAARRIESTTTRSMTSKPHAKAPRVPFRLASAGIPFVAFAWKSLISIGRFNPVQMGIVLAAFAVSVGLSSLAGQGIREMVGAMAAGMVLFVTILGPVVVRHDLRLDLLHLEMIKPYPLPGWGVVLGELLGPAAVLAAGEWVLILLAAVFLPSVGDGSWTVLERFTVATGAAILCPSLSLIALEIQNAAALVVPGWMQLGKQVQRGIEAMGQRLITMMATALMLLVALLPAGVVFTVAYFAGFWMFGFAAIPIAALVASMVLLIEAVIGVVWLGQLYDRIDVSAELAAPYA